MHPFLTVALTTFLAFCLFCLGLIFATKITSRPGKILLNSVAILASAPATLYVFYYTHLFDGAAWHYDLGIKPNTELLACGLGFLAGIVFAECKLESPRQKATIPIVALIVLLIPFYETSS